MKPAFRQPVLFLNLISDAIQGIDLTHAVYSMTIADEFTLRTPDALINGSATKLLIENCCPSLATGSIRQSDIQQILASIRIASTGNNLDMMVSCPHCKAQDSYELNLQPVISMLTAKTWFEPLKINNLLIYFSPPSYETYSKMSLTDFKINKQLYTISQMESPEEYVEIVSSLLESKRKLQLAYQEGCITKIIVDNLSLVTRRDFIHSWFNECEIDIQEAISEHINKAIKENKFQPLSITCDECKKPFTVPIDLDFSTQFRSKITLLSESEIIEEIERMGNETKNISNDLLKMIWYMRGSISYSEAFSLTDSERTTIAKIIENNLEITKDSGLPFF